MARPRPSAPAWSTTAPTSATWSCRARSAEPPSASPRPSCCVPRLGRVALPGRCCLSGRLGARLDDHAPPSASRSTTSSPSSAPAAPSPSPRSPLVLPAHLAQPARDRSGAPRHDPARRLRHRPDRPPRSSTSSSQPGVDVVAVNRSGAGQLPGATIVGGDATDPRVHHPGLPRAPTSSTSASTPPNYARWAEEFPPLQRGVLAGAAGGRGPPRRARQPLRLRARPAAATSSRPWPPSPPPRSPPPGPR